MTPSIYEATTPKHVTRLIVFEGVDPNLPNDDGDPALHCAIKRHVALPTLAELVRLGARVNLTNESNQSAVMLAVNHHDINVLAHLLDVGGNPNGPKGHLTPLHTAVYNTLEAQVEVLLEHGADPNHEGVAGITPLFFAKSRAMALRLIASGGDPYSRNFSGINALDYWKSQQHAGALEALKVEVRRPLFVIK